MNCFIKHHKFITFAKLQFICNVHELITHKENKLHIYFMQPRATFIFPKGEVSIKEKILDEGGRILSVNGLAKSHVLNGVCKAVYNDNAMNIKYRYKVRLVSVGFISFIFTMCNSQWFIYLIYRMMRYHLSPASLYHPIHYHLHSSAN